METFVRNSGKRRSRRKKRQKEFKLLKNKAQSPLRYLSISRLISKRENGNKVKNVIGKCVGCLIKSPCEQHISLYPNCENDPTKDRQGGENNFEQTIDLSDSENPIDNFRSDVVKPSYKVQRKDDVVIDLCIDHSDENEIIDLTETVNMAGRCCSLKSNPEPTVIDISQDDLKDQPSSEMENNEILVIGTFNKNSDLTKKCETSSLITVSNRWNNVNNLVRCSEKLKKKYLMKQSFFDKIDKKSMKQFRKGLRRPKENFPKIEENVYVNSPVTLPSDGLRPIIIDGSNVAFVHSNYNFSCKRLEICINYFKEKGHRVTAFVPQYRVSSHRSDDPQLLKRLERQGDVILTPSKKVDGRNIVPYDDRFIVQTAVLKGGIIVSRDNYNDLLKENPAWAETIKYRTLPFTWVDDVLMFPKDPLGEYGPTLEEFLRFLYFRMLDRMKSIYNAKEICILSCVRFSFKFDQNLVQDGVIGPFQMTRNFINTVNDLHTYRKK